MIISRTPLRISFAGGGSDLLDYYRQHNGCVLGTTINKYVYLSIHPYFYTNKSLIKYSETEKINKISEIKHPIIREVFSSFGIHGVDFNSNADIPSSGTGLGSSSAFTSALIALCNAYKGQYVSHSELAKLSCQVEIDCLKEPIGKQDQYLCTYGGLNYIEFNKDETVNVQPIYLQRDKLIQLQNRLVLVYTDITRSANSILNEQKKEMIKEEKNAYLRTIVDLCKRLKSDFDNNDIDNVGEILHLNWIYKKKLTKNISNSKIDNMYNKALKAGAEGGKLLGAGGGGFLLLYTQEKNKPSIKKAFKNYKVFDVSFDTTGTTIIYNN